MRCGITNHQQEGTGFTPAASQVLVPFVRTSEAAVTSFKLHLGAHGEAYHQSTD